MKHGDVVKPKADVIAMTGFTDRSRLTIRACRSNRHCVGCARKARQRELEQRRGQGRPIYAHQLRRTRYVRQIEPGELYAASGEPLSSLCLDCVEPL